MEAPAVRRSWPRGKSKDRTSGVRRGAAEGPELGDRVSNKANQTESGSQKAWGTAMRRLEFILIALGTHRTV